MADSTPNPTLRTPNGNFAAKVDEAGRIKLPAKVRDFLLAQPDRAMFATWNEPKSSMAKIYFNGSWEKNKEIASRQTTHREAAKAYIRLSNRYGGDVEIDSNGRVTLPMELRGALQLKDSPVQLLIFGEVVQIHKTDVLDQNIEQDKQTVAEALENLEVEGIQ
jgi:DNA-binding transcriptional regulator/RsmH inhibitor MraZ